MRIYNIKLINNDYFILYFYPISVKLTTLLDLWYDLQPNLVTLTLIKPATLFPLLLFNNVKGCRYQIIIILSVDTN